MQNILELNKDTLTLLLYYTIYNVQSQKKGTHNPDTLPYYGTHYALPNSGGRNTQNVKISNTTE